jgi:flagellar hook-basal body complex protein FliE
MALSAIASAAAASVRPALPSLPAVPALPVPAETAATTGAAASTRSSFAEMVSNAIGSLEATQSKADTLATQAATGTLTDVHDYLIAANEASLATELTVAVRNKAVDAFNQIMQMAV